MTSLALRPLPQHPPAEAGVSAIVVSYQTGSCLWDCIESIMAEAAIDELILVDNGNPVEVLNSLRWLAAREPRLRLVSGHGNVGFAGGCNRGAAMARGDRLLFLNPDLTLAPEAVSKLSACLEAAPARRGPLVVGGRLLHPSGAEQRGCRRDAVTIWKALVSFSGLGRLERWHPLLRDPHREHDPLPEGPAAVGAVSGAMLMLTREDFQTLGGFDEGYFLHVEDLDLCARAYAAGGEVVFHPAAACTHIGGASNASPLFVEQCKAKGFARYFKRFARSPAERLIAALLEPALGAIFTVRGALKALLKPAAKEQRRAVSLGRNALRG